MRTHLTPAQAALVTHAAINGGLCLLIGALLDGLRGSQAGLVAGIALAVLPSVWRGVVRVVRPESLLRLCAGEIGIVVTRLATIVIDGLGAIFGPLTNQVGPLLTRVRSAASETAKVVSLILGAAGRAVATPLGIANLGAVLVIGCELAHFDFAAIALFVALGGILLALLVAASEDAM